MVTYLRGDANAVMYTQFDADVQTGETQNILDSDMIVNSETDGTNCRWTISIAKDATSGTFQIRVINDTPGDTKTLPSPRCTRRAPTP